MCPPTTSRVDGREPLRISCVGMGSEFGASFADAVGDGVGVVETGVAPSAVRERVAGSEAGPDCVVIAGDAPVEPLALAEALTGADPDLPVGLYVADPDAYGPQAVLDAGVTVMFTPADDGISERLVAAAERYRTRRGARRDSAALSSLFEELPASVFVRTADGETLPEPAADPTDDPTADAGVLVDGESVDGELVYSAATERWSLVSKAPWHADGELLGQVGVAVDVTERRERERVLQSTSRLLRAIVGASPVPILLQARDGTVRLWNEAAEKLFGWSADEVIGEPYPPFVAEDDRAEFDDLLDRVVDSGRVSGVELHRRARDGTPLDLRLSAATVEPCDGERCIVSIISDVTALKDRERRLRRQNERIETFTTVLAHDLRNPVQVLRGQIGAGDLADAETAERALDRIEGIADDVVSLAGEPPVVSSPDVVTLSDAAREAWRDPPEASLTVAAEGAIRAHPPRLRRLLSQLFENSVEHSDGAVSVEVGDLPNGFYVADDGPGIDDRHRPHVREPGYTTKPGGTGYGLNAVAEVASAHGWTLRIRDADGGGTRIEITDVDRA